MRQVAPANPLDPEGDIVQQWQRQLARSITSAEDLAARFGVDPSPLREAARRYPLRITPHVLGLIREAGDPLWRQFVPQPIELREDARLCTDPLAEADHSPLPGIVHRHPDRALLLFAGSCPALCRFCFRKGRVDSGCLDLSPSQLEAAIAYLAGQSQIREVILTGGEPLLQEDGSLDGLLGALRRIDHLDLIRIHSRAPVVLPARITADLTAVLRRHAPLYLMLHVNHPRELSAEMVKACARLADAGIVLGSQSVLLRGVNDDEAVLEELMLGLLRLRVRPYYLHHLDLTAGTGHFRVPLERGLELLRHLQTSLPGLAVPHYVVDLPGGKGKVAVAPGHVESLGETARLRAPDGSVVEIPNR